MPVSISEMTIGDYDDAFALWTCTENVGLNEADSREAIEAYLQRNPHLSLVARNETRLVAAVLCGHDGRRGYLHHLAVAETYRQSGLGSQLVDICLEKLGALGIRKCNIFLYTHNKPGERFWKRTGWTERSELKILTRATPATDEEGGAAARR